jgi:hypothetical protein
MRLCRATWVATVVLLAAGWAALAGCDESPFNLDVGGTESDYLPAVFVTGKVLDWTDSDDDATQRWEASDPRLTGDLSYIADHVGYGPGSAHVANASVGAGTYEVVNEGGRWSGTATEMWVDVPRYSTHTVLLTGKGGYEGLSAYLVIDIGWGYDYDRTFKGLIYPDPMPAAPSLRTGRGRP